MPEKSLIVEAAAAEGIGLMAEAEETGQRTEASNVIPLLATVSAYMESEVHETPVLDRDN